MYNKRMRLFPSISRAAAALLLGLASPSFAVPPAAADDVNVLLITVDTLRPDRLSCYDESRAETPAIDALAARGVLFERAFAHNPTTLPSHANILTGMTPPHHGVRENSKAILGPRNLTLAEHLKGRGYATAAFVGAFPLDSRFGLDQGFDVYDDSLPSRPAVMGTYAERRAEEVVTAAAAWLSGRKGKWMCWIHLWDPHAPYAPPEPFLSRYREDPYSGEAAYVDAQLGVLFDGLAKSGELERTIVILTADHGESLGEHGEMTHSYFAYNSTIHVPLIIAGPGLKPSRPVPNVAHVDIFPTVCELTGSPAPKGLQGRSLAGLMKGRKRADLPVYFESLEPYLNKGCAPLYGFIEGQTKYMDSPLPEVYDLEKDFGEMNNLAGERNLERFREKMERLRASLSSPPADKKTQAAGAGTLEKLRTLGYVATPMAQVKSSYGPEDDLKSFLPYQQRLERAILMSDRGEAAAGVRELILLSEEKKEFAPAYIYLSQILFSLGRMDEAVRALERGLEVLPEDFSLLSSLGTLLVQTRQHNRAREILERALAVYEFDPVVWDNLGIVAMRLREYPTALECFAEAVTLDRTFALAFSNIGAVHLEMYLTQGRNPEDFETAIKNFEKAVALDPGLALAHRAMGVAFRQAGDLDRAIAAFERTVRLVPVDDFSTKELGLAHLEKGDKALALKYFEEYLRLRGDRISPEEKASVLALIEECRK